MNHELLFELRQMQLDMKRQNEIGIWATPAGRIVTWIGMIIGILGMAGSVVAVVGDTPAAFGRVAMFMLFFLFILRTFYLILRERMNRQMLLILEGLLSESGPQ
jgi:hypothetical protein